MDFLGNIKICVFLLDSGRGLPSYMKYEYKNEGSPLYHGFTHEIHEMMMASYHNVIYRGKEKIPEGHPLPQSFIVYLASFLNHLLSMVPSLPLSPHPLLCLDAFLSL